MAQNASEKFEHYIRKIAEIATEHNLPFILAVQTTADGKAVRAARGDIDQMLTLTAILLKQIEEETGESLKDITSYVYYAAGKVE